jgi:hypothetical protein
VGRVPQVQRRQPELSSTRYLPRLVLVALAIGLIQGCATGPTRQTVEPTEAIQAKGALREETLLDVGVHEFETVESDSAKATQQGFYPEVKGAESHFVPFHLKQTLQMTGQWGAVRVVPDNAEEVDVTVHGTIVESNGERLIVEVRVADATGRQWFNKRYEATIDASAYQGLREGERDSFQDLYNTIANDMLTFRQSLSEGDIVEVRTVAKLKFAADIAPYLYERYLLPDEHGHLSVNRLPAKNDPMYARVGRIREREFMFIDTVNGYYSDFYDDMWEPYVEWRKAHLQELEQKRELQEKAWTRRLLGVAAIIGAAAVGANNGDSTSAQAARDLMVIGGYEAIRSGNELAQDAKIHADALEELGASFGADVEPVVTEVEGRTVKLSGSVDQQYHEWQKILRELFAAETGETLPHVAIDGVEDKATVPGD